MLYLTAAYTGFRAGELRSLTPASFDLISKAPSVAVEAGYSKRRRNDTQPLRVDLAAELLDWLAEKPANLAVWPGSWHNDAAQMIRQDLDAAGLSYTDDSGKVFDFHALRHQYVSNLVAAGIHPKVAQQLARHSTIGLTMDRYTHLSIVDVTAAIDKLPCPPVDEKPADGQQKATGTDGRLAHPLALGLARKPFIACYGSASDDAGDVRSGSIKSNDSKDFGVNWLPSSANDQIRPAGIEPATCGLEVRCSIQLSYGRVYGLFGLFLRGPAPWLSRRFADDTWHHAREYRTPRNRFRNSSIVGQAK